MNRIGAYTIPVNFTDIGPDGVSGTGDDRQIQLTDRPANAPQDRVSTNPTDPAYQSTIWNVKFVGRYVMKYDIGLSGSYKVQSGRQWGRVTSVQLAGAGQENVRMEPVDANRAPTVDIMDLRVDKSAHRPLRRAVRLLGAAPFGRGETGAFAPAGPRFAR